MTNQLPLPVQLPDDETFASFEVGDNQVLLKHLYQVLQHKTDLITYISGEPGSGKSHLLYSLCADASDAVLVDFSQIELLEPEMMTGLEHSTLICLDNIHLLAGELDWQEAIFDLLNRGKELDQCHFVITGNQGSKSLALELADLTSRLTWGVSFHLQPLSDRLKVQTLIKRAAQRGLDLSPEVGRYLLTHCQRDLPALMMTLDKLDRLSLQQKRKLTIPFIKQVLTL